MQHRPDFPSDSYILKKSLFPSARFARPVMDFLYVESFVAVLNEA